MIERLVTTLRALASSPDVAPSPALLGDAEDALRLALDCPQQDWTVAQRASLQRLDALLGPHASAADVARAAREACAAFGIR